MHIYMSEQNRFRFRQYIVVCLAPVKPLYDPVMIPYEMLPEEQASVQFKSK